MFYKLQENSNSSDNIFVNKINKFGYQVSEKEIDEKNVIYALVDPNTFEIRYVGLTKDIITRMKGHLSQYSINSQHTYKNHWIKSLLENNQCPIVIILNEYKNREELAEEEINYIAYCKDIGCNLTNATDGGEGLFRHEFSEEHIKKLSESHRKHFFTEEQINEMIDLYKNGMSFTKLGEKFGCDRHIITDLIKENDNNFVKNSYKKFSKSEIEEMKNYYYNDKLSLNKIAEKFNCGSGTVLDRIKDGNEDFTLIYKRADKINLTDEDLEKIINYRFLGIDFNTIGKEYNCDKSVIVDFIRKKAPHLSGNILGYVNGIKPEDIKIKISKPKKSINPSPTKEQILKMVELYKNGYSLTKIGKEVNDYGRHTVKKYIELHTNQFITLRNSEGYKIISKEIEQEIVKYHKLGYSINKLKNKFECNPEIIVKILKEDDKDFKFNYKHPEYVELSDEDLAQITSLRYLGLSFSDIAELFDCSNGTIISFLRSKSFHLPNDILGYKVKPENPPKIKRAKLVFSEQQISKMINLYNSGYSLKNIAIQLNSNRKTIKKYLTGNVVFRRIK